MRRRRHRPPIACQHFVELVTGYLEGTLDDVTAAAVESHIDVCHHCIAYLEQMKQTIAVLGRVPLGALPEDARQTLLEAFRSQRSA